MYCVCTDSTQDSTQGTQDSTQDSTQGSTHNSTRDSTHDQYTGQYTGQYTRQVHRAVHGAVHCGKLHAAGSNRLPANPGHALEMKEEREEKRREGKGEDWEGGREREEEVGREGGNF